MNIAQLYPSKYISAPDIPSPVRVTIRTLTIEDLGDGQHKPCLYFINKEKGLILNKTNALIMAVSLGDESDAWLGKEIELFTEMKQFQGKLVQGISVRVPDQPPAPEPMAKPDPVQTPAVAAAIEQGAAAQRLDNLQHDIAAEKQNQDATAGDGFEDIPF